MGRKLLCSWIKKSSPSYGDIRALENHQRQSEEEKSMLGTGILLLVSANTTTVKRLYFLFVVRGGRLFCGVQQDTRCAIPVLTDL